MKLAGPNYFRDQSIALSLTVVTCVLLIGALWLELGLINRFVGKEDISLSVRPGDILIGLTIYLKTAIDFGIFIGRLMAKNPGLKGRIGIEIGTAVGNALGTMLIVLVWAFFKEVNWLLALMIILASLVLIRLAKDTIEHVDPAKESGPTWFKSLSAALKLALGYVNKFLNPLLSRLVPSHSLNVTTKKTFIGLLAMSFTVPFILGLDDFAGYVPLFDVVNVLGFGIGVLIGHMILNIFLYISPERTIAAVKNSFISIVGSLAFVGIAIWGFIEAFELLFLHH